MSVNTTWTPNFPKIDLLALYVTMYLKRIVVNKLPWKEHLDILYQEVKSNMEEIGKDKERYLFPTMRDFGRVYSNQWSMKEYGQEVGQPTFHTLLLVLVLRLGLQKLWVPDSVYFREDILIEGFLCHKPKLKLVYLSQGEPLYDVLVPLCPNLHHVSMPLSDNALFIKTVSIKNLCVLEFSTGVADKVICNSLWNIDKKSEKVLQMAVKDRKERSYITLSLPHLEILRSNIHKRENGLSSMKVTLGAAALVLQPKLRVVENKMFWTTLQAIHTLLEMENKYKIKHKRRLMVDQLVFDRSYTKNENFSQHLSQILDICPSTSTLIFPQCSSKLNKTLQPLVMMNLLGKIEKLTLDVTLFSQEDLHILIFNLGDSIKNLTLKISMALIDKFQPVNEDCEIITHLMLPSLKTLSLVLCDKKREREDDQGYLPTAMITFLSWFTHIDTLNYYNVLRVPPLFVVYECIGGAMGVMQKLSHLSVNGYAMVFPADLCKAALEEEIQIKDLLPELMADATFNILKYLESFEIDEVFLSPGVDRFLEALRTCNVHVKVMYRPQSLKGADPARYVDSNNYEALVYTPSTFGLFEC